MERLLLEGVVKWFVSIECFGALPRKALHYRVWGDFSRDFQNTLVSVLFFMNTPKNFNPEPFAYHQELILTIETLTNLGVGLGRVDGWVVMVPFALPGEVVKVRVFRNHKNFSEADLVEVVEASEERVTARCSLFGQCGGCQYQHFSYEAQLTWKRNQVVELMQRQAGIDCEVQPVFPSPKQYHYRSKISPHFQKPRNREDFPIGFLRHGQRNRILDVESCVIATELINEALAVERQKIRQRAKQYRKGGTLLLRHTAEGVTTDNNAHVSEYVGPVVYQFQAGDFFQNNPFILPDFLSYAVEQAAGEGIAHLVDTYCGSGAFALAGSKHFQRVAGVEVNANAIKWANVSATTNGIENCEFFIGKAEAIFEQIQFEPSETAAIIDPPRAGCDELFLNQLIAFGPEKIVYVSCEPSTQARDLKVLIGGGYAVTRIQPFDLFPQTRHIENIVTLSKCASEE